MAIDFAKIAEGDKNLTILDAALQYRDWGFSIIPIQKNKKPFIKWEQYQKEKPSLEQIKQWWAKWPNANVGIITGKISKGLCVADADSAAGLDKLNELIPEGLQFPMAATPGNGYHAYFCSNNGLGNATRFIKDCDFRAEGGYVVAPPSKGLNGKSYYWVPGHELLNDLIPVDLPEAIEQALKGAQVPEEPTKTTLDFNEGTRDESIFHLALSLAKGGMDQVEVAQAVVQFAQSCNPPFPNKEALIKVKSAFERLEKKENSEPKGGPNMADLRAWLDMDVRPGQTFTSRNACDGLGAYQREHKKTVYKYLSRLAAEGIIKKDKYLHGGFRRPLEIASYDLDSAIQVNQVFGVKLPLDLHNLLKIEPNHLVVLSGRFDAGKSSFLWHTMAINYEQHKIVHFSSPEWGPDSIKARMDELGIPRPHPNVTCYPMEPGYEDLIPGGPCIVLLDYLRAASGDFSDIDRQFYRILENLHGGICFAAIQKHPGLDRPIGGQFAVHTPHHVILLDKAKRDYICKIFKSKSEKDLEGLFRAFAFTDDGRQLVPRMDTWKLGEILWEKPKDTDDKNGKKD